nr:unnamed protein product [Callosobruchus analis]
MLCENLDSNHKVLLFHTDIRWSSKENMLARLCKLKEEERVFDFKADSTVKDDFQLLTLEQFWLKRYKINPSTYLCEAGFSALVSIKTKQRNHLNIEGDLRVALSSTHPRTDLILKNKQSSFTLVLY